MIASPMNTDTLITFEHPVNEQVRLYLRLEYLINEFHKNALKEDPNDSKQALIALLKIINVADRPDLKSKLVQQLSSHQKSLSYLSQSPDIDEKALNDILQQLSLHTTYLHEHEGKIGAKLRKNEFLNQIRLHLTNPAGACEKTLPPLNLWMHKPPEERQDNLKLWCQPFTPLLSAIELLLKLLRQSTQTVKATAVAGFYQQDQDATLPCRLIRISVPTALNVFPEFSANKHRIMIRFMTPDLYEGRKPVQTKQNVEFYLRCCRI